MAANSIRWFLTYFHFRFGRKNPVGTVFWTLEILSVSTEPEALKSESDVGRLRKCIQERLLANYRAFSTFASGCGKARKWGCARAALCRDRIWKGENMELGL